MRPIIDAHLDLCGSALSWNSDITLPIQQIRAGEKQMTDDGARGNGTVSLPEMRRVRVNVSLATILARAKPEVRPAAVKRINLDFATRAQAHGVGIGQLVNYQELERAGDLKMLAKGEGLEAYWRASLKNARESATLECLADHIDHICQLAGNGRHTAIGSDLDGGFGTE